MPNRATTEPGGAASTALREPTPWRALATVLVVSLVLKLVVLFWVGDIRPVADERNFHYAGESVAAGEGIHYEWWTPVHTPPLYALFMGLSYWLSGGPMLSKLIQVLMSTVTVWVVYLLGRRWFGSGAGVVAASITAFYPTLVAFTHYNWNETLYIFFLSLAFLGVWDARGRIAVPHRLFVAGVLFGLAALTRSETTGLVVCLVVWLLASRRPVRSGALSGAALVLGFALTIAPYLVHLHRTYGAFLMISSPADAGHAAYNAYPPLNWDWGSPIERRRRDLYLDHPWYRPPSAEENPVLAAREEVRGALGFMLEHPIVCVKRFFVRVVDLLNPTSFLIRHLRAGRYQVDRETGQVARGPPPRIFTEGVVLATVLSYIVVMVLATIGLCTLPKGPLRTFLLVSVGYILFVYGTTFAMSRYRLGAMPLLIIAAAAVVAAPLATREALRNRVRLTAAIVSLVLLSAVWAVHIRTVWTY